MRVWIGSTSVMVGYNSELLGERLSKKINVFWRYEINLHMFWMIYYFQILYVFFWVLPRRLIFVCRRFGTLYLFHLHRLDVKYEVYFILHIQPMKMEQRECSETSAYNNQTQGKYPKEYTQDSKHGESLKSRILSNS